MSAPFTLQFPAALDDATSLGVARNDAGGYLAATIAADATSLALTLLTDADEFGTSGQLTIDDEILYFTGRSGVTFSGLVRGQEGTTAASHAAGAVVECNVTAAYHSILSAAIQAIEAKVGIGAATPTAGKLLVGGASAGASDWRLLVAGDIPDLSALYQPLDGDLTAIAALATTSFGRSLLTVSDAAAARAVIGAGTSSFDGAFSSLSGKPTTLSGYGITDALAAGAVTGSGLTMNTNRLLGRTSASVGAVEEISVGSGLSLSGGTLSATGGGLTVGTTAIASGAAGRLLYEASGNVLGEVGTLTSDGSVLTMTRAGIGTTSADGVVLTNSTAAGAGAQQYSPRLRWTGQGWKTNATAASRTVDWIAELQPVQGAANPTANLVFSSQVNGGGYTAAFTLSSGGPPSMIVAGTTIQIGGNAAIRVNAANLVDILTANSSTWADLKLQNLTILGAVSIGGSTGTLTKSRVDSAAIEVDGPPSSVSLGMANVLDLVRYNNGTCFPQVVSLSMGRYQTDGFNGRTRLDVNMVDTGASYTPGITVMTLLASGSVGVGTNAPSTRLHVVLPDTTTNAVNTVSIFGHNLSSGTAAAGMGGEIKGQIQSSTTANQDAMVFDWSWVVATHASRTARSSWHAYDFNAKREAVRVEATGSAAAIGFLGANAIARPSSYTVAGTVTRTLPTDPSGAYTGIDNAQAGTVYAQLADLNTLRAAVSSLLGVVRQLITDLGSTSGYGLLAHS